MFPRFVGHWLVAGAQCVSVYMEDGEGRTEEDTGKQSISNDASFQS
jgi:hypothetical protein